MRPVLFYIPVPGFLQGWLPEQLPVFGYGTMVLLAYLSALILCKRHARKDGVDFKLIQDLMFWCLVSGVIGARIMHMLLYYHPGGLLDFYKLYEGGLVLYGGFITVPPVMHWFIKKHGLSWSEVLRIMLPPLPLAIGIGRLGCFLNGCCWGSPGSGSFCISFPEGSLYQNYMGETVHPVQVYAFVLGCGLSALLHFYRRKIVVGKLTAIFLIGYGVERIIEEAFRADTPLHVGGILTAGQAGSLILILVSFLALIPLRKGKHG